MTDELCIQTLKRAGFYESAARVQLLSERLADMTAERDTLKAALDKARKALEMVMHDNDNPRGNHWPYVINAVRQALNVISDNSEMPKPQSKNPEEK